MPGASLIALLDDIASVLDDVALLTKVATKKTAGVLGDDLALNAQQVAGVRAERELPIVWAVAKGSMVNKAILVPAALLISALAPWAVTPLLMIGGTFLCFEGFEKIAHKFFHDDKAEHDDQAEKARQLAQLSDPKLDVAALEKDKIKGAVRTDFILSAEIVTIALGTVADSPIVTRISVLTAIAALMTVGVYGLVAAIVKIDDVGAFLSRRAESRPDDSSAQLLGAFGRGIVATAPFLMKGLSIAGTVAMFLVGGGILMHGIPGAHDWLHHALEGALGGGPALSAASTLVDAVFGILVGALALLVVSLAKRLFRKADVPSN